MTTETETETHDPEPARLQAYSDTYLRFIEGTTAATRAESRRLARELGYTAAVSVRDI